MISAEHLHLTVKPCSQSLNSESAIHSSELHSPETAKSVHVHWEEAADRERNGARAEQKGYKLFMLPFVRGHIFN